MDDFFPVPLVYENRVDVIRVFISADRIHIGIQAFTVVETVFL